MAKETQTYTGYTNYETWAVCLWLDNEEYSSAWLHGVMVHRQRSLQRL